MINTKINLLQESICEEINKSKLPAGIVFYILKDILNKVQMNYGAELNSEVAEYEQNIQQNQLGELPEQEDTTE